VNSILDVDSYKASHFLQYPPGTQRVFSYLESRPGGMFDRTVVFGLKYILEKLAVPITQLEVEEAKRFFEAHGEPFPYEGWTKIAQELGGKLPLKIRALPEGEVVPVGIPLLTVENTDYRFPWLTNWIETRLMRVWYPITVATISWHAKKVILDSLMRTADDPWSELVFKLHDFGARGVSSEESAAIGGAAHLVNFWGSDTVAGVVLANRVYRHEMAGLSLPASEHSTITAWGRAGERDAYANMLAKLAGPGKILACVSDSYDLFNAVEYIWGSDLRQKVIDSGALVVIRPDSGNPPEIVVKTLSLLESRFGSKPNSKGYKVLNHVRVIQGDGIDNVESIKRILDAVEAVGFSATNVAFGMGGGLLQKCNRDTQRFAFKASEVMIDNVPRPIGKEPKTDLTKASKKGRLDVRHTSAYEFQTVFDAPGSVWDSAMRTAFFNGEVGIEDTLALIRHRADDFLKHSYQ
jgi:nicotinamide phosphoribosyltransferase